MSTNSKTNSRNMYISVFLIGLVCLMYELIQVRMLSFFMGSISNFLAIPIALLGLALGSLYCHLLYKGDRQRLIDRFSVLVFPSLALVFIFFFLVANRFYNEIHLAMQNPVRDAGKVLVYSGLFLPPYFLFGSLLSAYFSLASDRIGKLYFFDLAGAALGCLLTPVLLTFTDLAPVILSLLFGALIITLSTSIRHSTLITASSLVAFAVIQALVFSGTIFKEHPDPKALSFVMTQRTQKKAEEIDVRWNALARTSLLKITNQNGGSEFAVVQDDGLSNIWLTPYNPNATFAQVIKHEPNRGLPYILGQKPRNIMVMFAGAGRDLVAFHALSSGEASVTGVEINPAVYQAAFHPTTAHLGLRTLFGSKNVKMVIREGRDFLNYDQTRYDYIFVANNAAVFASRTGHTRKYLDTYEAMSAYMDRLSQRGMILFYNQPISEKVPSFRKIFKERNIPNFEQSVYMHGHRNQDALSKLIIKPGGFTNQEIAILDQSVRRTAHSHILYSPSGAPGVPRFSRLVTAPLESVTSSLITDDKPFVNKVDWSGFELFPNTQRLKNLRYASSWIKIFTIIVFSVIALLIIGVIRFAGGRENRLPTLWILYFLMSGISYMAVEIGLIAKTELFMGNPLYAVAVILASFLLSNSLGAYAQDRYRVMRGPKTLILLTSVAVIWGIVTVGICNTYLLSIPLIFKIVCVMLSVFPVGACLGMYYPCGVAAIVEKGMAKTVPATYGMATLSSVLGSAWAMSAITNLGFSVVIGIGAVGYMITAGLFLAARRVS